MATPMRRSALSVLADLVLVVTVLTLVGTAISRSLGGYLDALRAQREACAAYVDGGQVAR